MEQPVKIENPYKYRFGKFEQVTKFGHRFYQTPVGDLPSVTTIISLGSDSQWLRDWRAKVGDKEADRVSGLAKRRGTAIHELVEATLLGYDPKPSIYDLEVFRSLKPSLALVSDIECLETCLYSRKLGTAGSTDLIAKFDGVRSVIDFKTSAHDNKTDADIQTYFWQETAYACCYAELTNKPLIKQLVTIIANDMGSPQVFVRPLKREYIEKFLECKEKASLHFQSLSC